MSDSVRDDGGARRRLSLDDLGAKRPAKAQLRADESPQQGARRMRDVAAEALRRVTSQKAAATEIEIDQSRLSHKLKDGTLTIAQLERLGATYAVQFGRDLLQEYGAVVKSPKERARERLPEIIQELLELTA